MRYLNELVKMVKVRLARIRLYHIDISEMPTIKLPVIKIRDNIRRDGFTSSDKTEVIPAINTSRTERVPVYDEMDIIERTIDVMRDLK